MSEEVSEKMVEIEESTLFLLTTQSLSYHLLRLSIAIDETLDKVQKRKFKEQEKNLLPSDSLDPNSSD